MNLLKNNWKIKLLSLFSALILWTFVMGNTNPLRSKMLRQIPVRIINIEKLESSNLAMADSEKEHLVDIKILAQRNLINNIEKSDIIAKAEILNFKEGLQTLRVKIDSPNGVTTESVKPRDINIKLEKIIELKKPVEIIFNDKLTEDKILESSITPSEVSLKGPRQLVEKCDKLVCFVNDVALVSKKPSNIKIIPLDKNNNEIEGLSLSKAYANVSVSVTAIKEVKIKLVTTGKIKKNYKLLKTEVYPDTILLNGDQKALEKLESVNTVPVDITDLEESKQDEVTLELPRGVLLNDKNRKIMYKIEITKDKN